MHYLIDGHNLIARLPDISLEDPYDEAKLVLQLRSWQAAGRNRLITVIFDGGLPGGEWRHLSTGRLKAIFASENSTADALLRKRVNEVKDTGAYTLVSSDQAVLSAAKRRRMPYMTAEGFAGLLADFRHSREKKQDKEKADAVGKSELEQKLTNEEVAEWLQLFESAAPKKSSGDDTPAEKPAKKRHSRRNSKAAENDVEKPAQRPAGEAAEIKSGMRKLNTDEVSEWLEIFGKGDDQ